MAKLFRTQRFQANTDVFFQCYKLLSTEKNFQAFFFREFNIVSNDHGRTQKCDFSVLDSKYSISLSV